MNKASKSNIIYGNRFNGFYYGVLDSGKQNIIQSNHLTYNKAGIYLSSTAKYSKVNKNNVYKNTNYGVYNKATKTIIYKNKISSNKKYGLITVKSANLNKNSIKKNKINLRHI